jgi:hypothetical protein
MVFVARTCTIPARVVTVDLVDTRSGYAIKSPTSRKPHCTTRTLSAARAALRAHGFTLRRSGRYRRKHS